MTLEHFCVDSFPIQCCAGGPTPVNQVANLQLQQADTHGSDVCAMRVLSKDRIHVGSCLKILKLSSSLQDARLHWLIPLTQVYKLIAHFTQPRSIHSKRQIIKSEADTVCSTIQTHLLYQYSGHTHSPKPEAEQR